MILILFAAPFRGMKDEDFTAPESIEFINIDTIKSAKRVTEKKLAHTSDDENSRVERARVTVDDADAVDISFYPNIAPPRPLGRLRKIYPSAAREMVVESVVNVEILISAGGKVRQVKVIGVRLSKSLPRELRRKLSADFSRDARRILMGARFTPPVVEGRRVPVRMEMPLRFRLD